MPRRGSITFIAWAVLTTVSAIVVNTPTKIIESARGQSANLPCKYQSTASRTSGSAEWKRIPSQEEVTTYFFGDITTNGTAYEGRVSFTGNVVADDASINIKQLRMEDNGTYQCEITFPRDRTGTPFATLELVVLVAPSKPNCAIVGTAEYGQVITLTCVSSEGSPQPEYAWQSYTPQNVPRQLPLTSETNAGSLTLKNISMDTSGFFICTSKNKVGAESCNLTLAVMPPSMNIGFYAGIIGGSVAGIIVIGIIVYCCCCRDKDEKNDYEMAEREQEESENVPQKSAPQHQQRYDDYDENDEDDDNSSQRRPGPPMPPANKPRLVIDNMDV